MVSEEGETASDDVEYRHGLTPPMRDARRRRFRREPDLNVFYVFMDSTVLYISLFCNFVLIIVGVTFCSRSLSSGLRKIWWTLWLVEQQRMSISFVILELHLHWETYACTRRLYCERGKGVHILTPYIYWYTVGKMIAYLHNLIWIVRSILSGDKGWGFNTSLIYIIGSYGFLLILLHLFSKFIGIGFGTYINLMCMTENGYIYTSVCIYLSFLWFSPDYKCSSHGDENARNVPGKTAPAPAAKPDVPESGINGGEPDRSDSDDSDESE